MKYKIEVEGSDAESVSDMLEMIATEIFVKSNAKRLEVERKNGRAVAVKIEPE